MAQLFLFIKGIGQIFAVIGKVIDLYREKDAKKAEEKKKTVDKLTDAIKETDRKKRASAVNMVLDDIGRL